MQINKCFIILIALFSLFISCKSSFKAEINKNYKETNKLFEKLKKNNGNAFCTSATYSNLSYVWSYNDDKIVFFQLIKGKISKQKEYSIISRQWLQVIPNKKEKSNTGCGELDGDYIKYSIQTENGILKDVLPVDIKCFVEAKKSNEFYKNLSDNIVRFKAFWN